MKRGDPLPDTRPVTLASAFLEQHMPKFAHVTWATGGAHGKMIPTHIEPIGLRYWREEFFRFSQYVYRRWVQEELESEVTLFLNSQRVFLNRDKENPLHVDGGMVSNVMKQLRAICQVRCEQMPAWLNAEQRPDPKNVIAFRNGLIDMKDWVVSDEVDIEASTPDWFSEAVLPCIFDVGTTCPEWEEYLNKSQSGDTETIEQLQEFFGLCLTGDTSFQKMLWLIGDSGTGKTTFTKVLQHVVGATNSVSFSLWDLTNRFTLSTFMGKTLAISGDAHLGRDADSIKIIEHIKAITGEDDRMIDRKNRELLGKIRLSVRFVIAANDFPSLPDSGDTLRRRSLIVPFDKMIEGYQDPHKAESLMQETPGIAMWALRGARRLYIRGHFAETKRGREMQDEFSRLTSPITSFIEDCFLVSPIPADPKTPGYVLKDHVWTAYGIWRVDNHQKWTPARDRLLQSFFRAARAYARRSGMDIRDYRPKHQANDDPQQRPRAYCGIELKNDMYGRVIEDDRIPEFSTGGASH